MSDSKKTSTSSSSPNTTEVLGRVEGVCKETGRPRVIRLWYPEDDYSPGQDTHKRKHVMVQCQASDVAKVAKT